MKLFRSLLSALAFSSIMAAQVDVLMNRYDSYSHGANTQERVLNTANVNGKNFGKLHRYYVDGAVYAQPLYVHNVATGGGEPLNVLYVATMNDKVYAFDASHSGPPLWLRDFTDERSGVTPVPVNPSSSPN